MAEKAKVNVSVVALFIKDGKILLTRRVNTGWGDGKYSVPAGRVDKGETPKQSLVREIKEEVGVDVSSDDLDLIYLDYVADSHVNFYFKIINWAGEPQIMEPEKCDDMRWFNLDDLPENIAGHGKAVLQGLGSGRMYDEYDEDIELS